MVKINGTASDLAGQTVAQYLAQAGWDAARLAVERNGDIVPRARYGETVLEDGDVLEIVRFVGGG